MLNDKEKETKQSYNKLWVNVLVCKLEVIGPKQ